jgi:hypothetical protein
VAVVFIKKMAWASGGRTTHERGGSVVVSCSRTCMNDVWRLGPKPTGGMGVLVRARTSVDLDDRVWWPLAVAMVWVALGRRVARAQSHARGVVGLHQSSLLPTPCLVSVPRK